MRVPGAPQHTVMRCRPGTPVCDHLTKRDPASAMHHFVLHRVWATRWGLTDSPPPGRFGLPLAYAFGIA